MEIDDVSAVVKVLKKGTHSLDFDLFSHALYSQGVITQGQYRYIQHDVEQFFGCEQHLYWFQHIARLITFEQMIEILRFIGLDDLASDISEHRIPLVIRSDSVSEMPNSVVLYSDYTALSKKRDNCIQQINMEVDFENMTSFLIRKLQFKNDIYSRQMALDKLAIVVGIRHFILNTENEIRAVLVELKSIKDSNPDLDQRFSTAFYLSARIYLNIEAKELGMAENCLVELKQLCFNNGPNWLKVIVFMTEQFLYRRKYYLDYDKTFLHRSIEACDKADSLISLESDSCFKRNFFQLSKIITLLSTGIDFSNVRTTERCKEHIMCAKALLTTIGRNYGQLSNREKMIYRQYMAKIHEKDNPRLALANAKMAKDMETCAHMTKVEKDKLSAYIHNLQEIIDITV